MCCSGDGAVTGMALMRAAILTVEQIGVDGDGFATNVQERQFIGQKEKFSQVFLNHENNKPAPGCLSASIWKAFRFWRSCEIMFMDARAWSLHCPSFIHSFLRMHSVLQFLELGA